MDMPVPETRLRKAVAHPRRAVQFGSALLRGHLYKTWYRLRGVRFTAGRNFCVYGRLSIKGPGQVVFGDNVSVEDLVTPWTYDVNARILIGDNVMLAGTRFGCKQEIIVGRDSILADASIADTAFHSIRSDRRTEAAPVRVAPVVLGENVWLARNVGILPGTKVGNNSVVGYGAVCVRDYPADVVIFGNPAKVIMAVPHPASLEDRGTAADSRSAFLSPAAQG
jgi:acetyltransferase-like isoleucine patch superfamily enzyme